MDRVTQRLWRGVEGPRRCSITHAARSFSTTEARQQDLLRYALDDHGYICFMHCNRYHSQVFELRIDRANEVELLFAPPAFELFFLSDGCANVFVALEGEQALAAMVRGETGLNLMMVGSHADSKTSGRVWIYPPRDRSGRPSSLVFLQ